MTRGHPNWTADETTFLMEHRDVLSFKELSSCLPGRSEWAIRTRLHYLGAAAPVVEKPLPEIIPDKEALSTDAVIHRWPKPDQTHAAMVKCLSCQKPFWSYNRKRNRMCHPCLERNGPEL